MTKTMKDLLFDLFGPFGGQVGDDPKNRRHVSVHEPRNLKAARQLEEIGIVSLKETNIPGLYLIRTKR